MVKSSYGFKQFVLVQFFLCVVVILAFPYIMAPREVWSGNYSHLTFLDVIIIPLIISTCLFNCYRLSGYLYYGTLIKQETFEVVLPTHKDVLFKISQLGNVKVIIFLHNADIRWLNGEISVKIRDGSKILLNKLLVEPRGKVVKNIYGELQTVSIHGKRGARLKRIEVLEFLTSCIDEEVLLTLDLNWNFQGWNSSLERRLPDDKVLMFEVLVRAAA